MGVVKLSYSAIAGYILATSLCGCDVYRPQPRDTPARSKLEPPAPGGDDWVLSTPRRVGTLVGPNVEYKQAGLQFYGTDLGFSFEHDGRIVITFGDTYATANAPCTAGERRDDDVIGWLPLDWDGASIPQLEVPTNPDTPTELASPALYRDGEPVILDAFKVPVAGFSDGEEAYVVFQTQSPVRCDVAEDAACPAQEGVSCVAGMPICKPAPITVPILCERTLLWCAAGQCSDIQSVCVDLKSSQNDDTARGIAASVMSYVDIATLEPGEPQRYRTAVTWPTHAFSHPTMRTVQQFSGRTSDNDYTRGTNALLIWGRPGISAEEGREARIYFATHPLPFARDGAVDFAPRYFAGLDEDGEPRWSARAGEAQPLALDGEPGGDPAEEIPFVGTTAISWLGEPVNRWIMMYGGDLSDQLLAQPTQRSNVAVVVRFAEHPWGPWSAPVAHLEPGVPGKAGDLYGPGGILYHPECVDTAEARCAEANVYTLTLLGGCAKDVRTELGRLYAPNIIDPYTRPNERGGLDITWVVSTWNPYTIELFQSSIDRNESPP